MESRGLQEPEPDSSRNDGTTLNLLITTEVNIEHNYYK